MFPGMVLQSEKRQRYTLERKLGSGGFADVFLVRNDTQQPYALKILRLASIERSERPEILHRFEREYTCCHINSPFLVHSHDKGMQEENPYYVMDFCDDGNLELKITQGLAKQRILDIAVDVLCGLSAIHSEGIIHRDLKPANVLFRKGKPLLSDFGISGYLKARVTVRDWMGHVKSMYGTLVYMPPEQLNSKEAFLALGPVTDIFAFGVILHQILTDGLLPFGAYSEAEEEKYLQRLRRGDWVVFNQFRHALPKPWDTIIEGCLQPNPVKRFQLTGEILSLLNRTTSPVKPVPTTGTHWVLKVMQGDEHGRTYPLTKMAQQRKRHFLTVGWYNEQQPDSNDIGIVENYTQYVSRFHATLEYMPDQQHWYIRDGQWRTQGTKADWFLSTNGVLVNSRKIDSEGWMLLPNDIITLGDTTLRIEIE
jgi:serine/threonine protein kinase